MLPISLTKLGEPRFCIFVESCCDRGHSLAVSRGFSINYKHISFKKVKFFIFFRTINKKAQTCPKIIPTVMNLYKDSEFTGLFKTKDPLAITMVI